jgi:hypothetical protein
MTFIGLFLYLWYKLGHREGLDRFADWTRLLPNFFQGSQ